MDPQKRKYEIQEEIDHLMLEANWISTRIIELKIELEEINQKEKGINKKMRTEYESSL